MQNAICQHFAFSYSQIQDFKVAMRVYHCNLESCINLIPKNLILSGYIAFFLHSNVAIKYLDIKKSPPKSMNDMQH